MNVIWFDYALPCICSFLACLGFTLVFNIHGVGKLICGVGSICWPGRPFLPPSWPRR